MKHFKVWFILFIMLLMYSCSTSSDDSHNNTVIEEETELYFPPISGTTWESSTPSDLGWNEAALTDLYTYLDEKHSKGFMILKNGKIVVEKYFNNHSPNADWAWFSAAKSLTATAIGIAQDEGIININNKTSDYLGSNWSSLTQEQQDVITVKHHLTMTTGLEDNIDSPLIWACTLPNCFTFNSAPSTRWSYHQGAFTVLQDIITQNSGVDFKAYFETKILDKVGMAGSWNNVLSLNIFSSNTRSMARFGLLMLNKGTWSETEIVTESYFNEMTNTSQNLNKSYGYLWWLNGKESFMTPGPQQTFQGFLVPNTPSDMIAALGANDQKIYVIPSQNLVVIRCGESAGVEQLANSSFDNDLWGKINAVIN